MNKELSSWLVRKPRPKAKIRLFCFPYAGGGASAFRTWPDALPHIDICAVQPPGRETRLRDAPFVRMEPFLDALMPAIRPLFDIPFAFYGHSLGAYVAYEIAHRLRAEGGPQPSYIFIGGSAAPQVNVIDHPIAELDDQGFREGIESYEGTPAEVLAHKELWELLLPALRADFRVYENYVYTKGDKLDVPFSAFGGLLDKETTREELEAWKDLTNKAFQVRMVPGNHFFMHSDRTKVLSSILQDLAPFLR
ncbi:MAG: thioesterase domain-containing protein [Byssovorax sp.]